MFSEMIFRGGGMFNERGEIMKLYVIYIMADYAHAVGITTNEQAANKYADKLRKRLNGTNRSVWVNKIKVTDKITELDCN